MVLRREISWTIVEPNLEQLYSLVIPFTTMDRYIDVVDRLVNLIYIRSFLDKIDIFSENEIFLRNKQHIFDLALTTTLQL